MGRDKKPLTKISNSERGGGGEFALHAPPPQICLGAMGGRRINDLGAMAVSSVV